MSLTNTAIGMGLRWAVIPKALASMVTFRKGYRSHAAGVTMIVGSLAIFWLAEPTPDEALAKVQAMAALFGVVGGVVVILLRLGLTGAATFLLETILKELATTKEQLDTVQVLTEAVAEQAVKARVAAEAAAEQATAATVAAQAATNAALQTTPIDQVKEIVQEAVQEQAEKIEEVAKKQQKPKAGHMGRS